MSPVSDSLQPRNAVLTISSLGIHGMPFKPRDGVQQTADWQEENGFGGYCTHSSVLFAPWHRPYLALFEVSN